MNALLEQLVRGKKCVSPGLAARALDICPSRVWQLIYSGKLKTVSFFGARFVTVESMVSRARKKASSRKTGL